jgi:uncharacterized OB-fold protein
MKYKCKKCGTVFTPGSLSSDCPKCGSWDVEVIYEHVHRVGTVATPAEK